MKASIGVRTHRASSGDGSGDGGRTIGRSDHQSQPSAAAVGGVGARRGSGAPISIQRRKSAITGSGSLPRGGILNASSSCSMARISKLSSIFPGTTAGPEFPPRRMPCRVSSLSPPLGRSASPEWQE
jgi:hypothetical protein